MATQRDYRAVAHNAVLNYYQDWHSAIAYALATVDHLGERVGVEEACRCGCCGWLPVCEFRPGQCQVTSADLARNRWR